MGQVVYWTSLSMDGYIDAANGDPSWVAPDEELHTHFNDVEREINTHLYGRRMYELMAAYWPTADEKPSAPPYEAEYARLWRAVPKVVFSKTLEKVDWNSRLVRGNAIDEVAELRRHSGMVMSVGGTILASALAAAGLIDEYRLYYVPILLGAGTQLFAGLDRRIKLRPIETRTFSSGTILVRCRPSRQ
jgi:dihydrofolate reductase